MERETLNETMRFLTTVVLLFALSDSCPAIERWISHGPYGGSTSVLLPARQPGGGLYAGVLGHGVYFRNETPGSTWVRRSEGMVDLYVRTVAQDPADPEILYAGTRDGIYRSTDGGLHWTARNGGVDVVHVETIAVDPDNPQVLYAGAIWQSEWAVYKTCDAGQTWNPVGPGIPVGLEMREILVDPHHTQIVYVGTADPYSYVPDDAGVYKSTDGGESWLPSGSGLLNTNLSCLAFDPQTGATLYAGTSGGTGYRGVYVSHDAAGNWNWISNGLPSDMGVDAIAVLYAPDGDVPTLHAAGSHASSLSLPPKWEPYLYRSDDGGANWSSCASGITFPSILSLIVDPGNPQIMYAGTDCGGVFRSTDGGAHWSHWSTGLAPYFVKALGVHPWDHKTLYAVAWAVDALHSERDAGVFVTFDGGFSWEPRGNGLFIGGGGWIGWSVAVDPLDPQILYVANRGSGLYKSTNGGLSWDWRGFAHGISNLWLKDIAIDPSDPRNVYVSAAGYEPWYPDIFKSQDRGETWQGIASNLIWAEFMGLAIDPVNTLTVYAGSGWEGVWKTSDGGQTWTKTGPQVHSAMVNSLVVDPQDPQHVFAADNQYNSTGVYVSHDGGGVWQFYNENLKVLDVEDLAFDPGVTGPGESVWTLYAATEGGGVFRQYPRGIWEPINTGLKNLNVYAVVVAPLRASGITPTRSICAGTAAGAYVWARLAAADLDQDGDVDADDLAAFESCASGPGVARAAGCENRDFDKDSDVDQADFAVFQRCFSGADVPAEPGCAD